MSPWWWRAGRAVLVAGAGAGLVAASSAVPGSLVVQAPAAQAALGTTSVVPTRQGLLACPGPETEGIAGVPAVPGGATTVYAVAAPIAALTGIPVSGDPGTLAVSAQPAGTPLGAATARGAVVTGPLAGAALAEVRSAGALAAGTAAVQTWLRRDSDDRGLVAAACTAPRPEGWLLAGGGDSTRRERLVLANPGANVVTVDVEVLGGAGRVPTPGGSRLAVPPHGRIGLLVDALAPGEQTPVVHVTATGGLVSAVLEDSWIEGAVGRGRDDVTPADGPGTDLVVPAGSLSGPARLRVAVTGAAEAVVQSRVLTPDGPQALPADGVVRVRGGSTRDIDLSALPPGAYAVQVRSDQPVVAAVMAERRPAGAGPSDFGWIAATPSIPVLGGTSIPPVTSASLLLVGTGGDWAAAVYVVGADGAATTRAVSGSADTVASLDVTGAASVWVRPASGTVRAGVSLQLDDPAGALFSLLPVLPTPTTSTDVPVREVRR